MESIEVIEQQLEETYDAFDFRALHTWPESQVKARMEELLALQVKLTTIYGELATDALDIIACELYDLDDELEERDRDF